MKKWPLICGLAASVGILLAQTAVHSAEPTAGGPTTAPTVKVRLSQVALPSPHMIFTPRDSALAMPRRKCAGLTASLVIVTTAPVCS